MKKLSAMVAAGGESGHVDHRGPFQPVFKSLDRETLVCLGPFLQLSYALFLLLLYSRHSYHTVQHLGTLWIYTQTFFGFILGLFKVFNIPFTILITPKD